MPRRSGCVQLPRHQRVEFIKDWPGHRQGKALDVIGQGQHCYLTVTGEVKVNFNYVES